MGDYLGEMAADYAVDFTTDYVLTQLAPVIQSYMWIVVLVSIPALALAVAYCFLESRFIGSCW